MSNKAKKTVFVFISQSVIVKNVLRSGGFDLFKKTGHRIFVFIKCKEIPDYMKQEFQAENITLVPIFSEDRITNRWETLLGKFGSYLLWNDTSKRYFRYSVNFRNRSQAVKIFHMIILRTISGTVGLFPFSRKMIRWVSSQFFPEKFEEVSFYFDKHNP